MLIEQKANTKKGLLSFPLLVLILTISLWIVSCSGSLPLAKEVQVPFAKNSPDRMPPHPDLYNGDLPPSSREPGDFSDMDPGETSPYGSKNLTDKSPSGRSPSLKSFPTSGTQKVLVIMAGFSNIDFDTGSTPSFYDGLFTNGPGGDGFGWKQYYRDMSDGRLTLEFDVYDVGQVSQTGTYYNDDSHEDRLGEYVTEAVNLGNSTIDYSQYDNDGDGYVDAVVLIHPGQGGEVSGNSQDIWSHRWSILGTGNPTVILDGVTINDYTMQPEYVYNPGDSTIGVFVHEFGHILGLPDLYDTSGTTQGIGAWGVMSSGSWLGPNGWGARPAPLCPWSREVLGWVEVVTAEVPPLSSVPQPPQPPPPTPYPLARWNALWNSQWHGEGFSARGFREGSSVWGFGAALGLLLFGVGLYLLQHRKKPKARYSPVYRTVLYYLKFLFLGMALVLLPASCGEDPGITTLTVELQDIDISKTVAQIPMDDDEYLLIANFRDNNNAWSQYLPGDGLLILHVDQSLILSRWSTNSVNDYSSNGRFGIAVIEADNNDSLLDPLGTAASYADLFFAGNRDNLQSIPLDSGSNAPVSITNISSPGSTMSFDVNR